MRFRIYRNIHTKKWSIQEKVGGKWKVTHKLHIFAANNCTFKVYEKGRQRVLREKKKNVHALVLCEDIIFANIGDFPLDIFPKIEYSPYLADHFSCKGEKIEKAETVYFDKTGAYLIC